MPLETGASWRRGGSSSTEVRWDRSPQGPPGDGVARGSGAAGAWRCPPPIRAFREPRGSGPSPAPEMTGPGSAPRAPQGQRRRRARTAEARRAGTGQGAQAGQSPPAVHCEAQLGGFWGESWAGRGDGVLQEPLRVRPRLWSHHLRDGPGSRPHRPRRPAPAPYPHPVPDTGPERPLDGQLLPRPSGLEQPLFTTCGLLPHERWTLTAAGRGAGPG